MVLLKKDRSQIFEYVINLKNVCVRYGKLSALDIDELRIERSERIFVLGRSGSGKTTLSKLIKGRIEASGGEVNVLGLDPFEAQHIQRRESQQRIAMIDQEFFLIPRLSVVNNVLLGCLGRVSPWKTYFGWYPADEWEKAESILNEVGLRGIGHRRVETLSGGQRQRAAIARALMQDADIILADEPVSNLDPEFAVDVLKLLVDCAERRSVTLLVNIHQPSLARKFASRFIGLADGKVIYDGPPINLTADNEEFIYRGNGKEK